jgi:hypothetical protein
MPYTVESVLPLDSASKDVKNSSLLSDTLEEQEYMTETLQKIEVNRNDNLKLLKHSFSSQSQQYFSAASLLGFFEHGSQIVSMMNLQVEIL